MSTAIRLQKIIPRVVRIANTWTIAHLSTSPSLAVTVKTGRAYDLEQSPLDE